MALVNMNNALSLAQAADVIVACPQNRYNLVGEPGIGKSSITKILHEKTGMEVAYIDVPNLDLGDTAMPVINRDNRTTEYFPNARFKLQDNKPVIIMLDEYSKGVDPVKNMLHPLFETNNPRLGDVPVHPESLIFLTGNLSSDGVGDSLKAHSRNRVSELPVAKPNDEQWLAWAAEADIDPVAMAFVDQYPHCLASYLDSGQEDNPYIYHPSKNQPAFLTPRSLERASNILKGREGVDSMSLQVALAGTIGAAGAADMSSFINYQDDLPKWADIIKNPEAASIPKGAGACSVMVFGAVQKIEAKNINQFMKYVDRMASEWQTIFCLQLAKSKSKQQVAFKCKAFANWVGENEDLL